MTQRITQRTPGRMTQQTLRRILTLATLTLLSATIALAQTAAPPAHPELPSLSNNNWSYAKDRGVPERTLFVITTARSTHRINCRARTFTDDQLTCKGPFGRTRTYKAQDIAALILSGEDTAIRHIMVVVAVISACAIAGAVFLNPVARFGSFLLGLAGGAAFLILEPGLAMAADDQPDELLYLAPGQTLQVKTPRLTSP